MALIERHLEQRKNPRSSRVLEKKKAASICFCHRFLWLSKLQAMGHSN